MTVREYETDALEQQALLPLPRFGRFGRLAPVLGAPEAAQVRCACNRCGAHLLAVRRGGELDGACPVCMFQRVSPVDAHRAAA